MHEISCSRARRYSGAPSLPECGDAETRSPGPCKAMKNLVAGKGTATSTPEPSPQSVDEIELERRVFNAFSPHGAFEAAYLA